MSLARQRADGRVQWVEVCFCSTPIAEERPYWEEYFELLRVQDAHPRSKCRDLERQRALGLRRLRLHRAARAAHGDVGALVLRGARGR